MNQNVFRTKFAASVWNTRLVNKRGYKQTFSGEKVMHTISILHQRKDLHKHPNLINGVMINIKSAKMAVDTNSFKVENLLKGYCLTRSELIDLAEKSSFDNWPFNFVTKYRKTPYSLMLIEIFRTFDDQSLVVDALQRTNLISKEKAQELRKELAKPIRNFIRETFENIPPVTH